MLLYGDTLAPFFCLVQPNTRSIYKSSSKRTTSPTFPCGSSLTMEPWLHNAPDIFVCCHSKASPPRAERLVTLPELRIVNRLSTPQPSRGSNTNRNLEPSLSSTRSEREAPTEDVAEEAFRALSRICFFLAANTALGLRRDDLAAMSPFIGLGLYIAAMREYPVRIGENTIRAHSSKHLSDLDSGRRNDGTTSAEGCSFTSTLTGLPLTSHLTRREFG